MKVLHNKLTDGQHKRLRSHLNPNTNKKYLGSGATATVYQFNAKTVLRIQEADPDYDPQAYLDWAQFCLKSRSKHVPQFHYLAVEHNRHGDLVRVVSVIEKLESIEYDDDFDAGAYRMENFFSGYGEYCDLDLPKKVKAAISPRAARYIRDRARRVGIYMNDLHGGNWMLRKSDGKVVITDPCC